jgi:Ca2+-transporting ATPase
VLLLAAAALLAALVGEAVEALAIGAVLVLNAALGFWTEWGARQAMHGLQRLQLQSATVRRDGHERVLDAAELVAGDVVLLAPGDAVPADARLLSASELQVIEAPLTGEPFPVAKGIAAVAADALLAERAAMVYKGTMVAAGSALAVVTATGVATEVGRIGALVADTAEGPTPLERKLDQLGRRLVGLTLGIAALVTLAGIWRGGSLWLMVETGIALAVAAVPEGLPAVATITLAVGLHRMARRRVLVRRLTAVETLGAATVVGCDKTGTLTRGEMAVTAIVVAGARVTVSGSGYRPQGELRVGGAELPTERLGQLPGLRELLVVGALCNRARLVEAAGEWQVEGDPTEGALLVVAAKAGLSREQLLAEQPEVAELPFSSERMLMATFHRRAGGGARICVKGAPRRVIEHCARVLTHQGSRPLDAAARGEALAANRELAGDGLRVLAIAEGELPAGATPGEEAVRDLLLLGFAGIADPPDAEVPATIAALQRAGVRTLMLTGDQTLTAQAVARQLGILRHEDVVLDGAALRDLGEEELAARLQGVGAFSRVEPADKLRIVAALQRRGEIVAMLGDGVNDAPALKRADVGVAMGKRGTDVAKETADVVLADDRFAAVAAAVEQGRVIYDNIRKSVFYLFSSNLSEVLVLFLALLVGAPLPLLPLQILWLNLVTDVFPALALAMEPAEPDVMRRPPRPPQAALLSGRFLLGVALHGGLLAATSLGVFAWALAAGEGEAAVARARAMTFLTLALGQLWHVHNARSDRPVLLGRRALANRWVWGAMALTLALQGLAVSVPALSTVLALPRLAAADWAVVLLASLLPLAVGQAARALQRGRGEERGRP